MDGRMVSCRVGSMQNRRRPAEVWRVNMSDIWHGAAQDSDIEYLFPVKLVPPRKQRTPLQIGTSVTAVSSCGQAFRVDTRVRWSPVP